MEKSSMFFSCLYQPEHVTLVIKINTGSSCFHFLFLFLWFKYKRCPCESIRKLHFHLNVDRYLITCFALVVNCHGWFPSASVQSQERLSRWEETGRGSPPDTRSSVWGRGGEKAAERCRGEQNWQPFSVAEGLVEIFKHFPDICFLHLQHKL